MRLGRSARTEIQLVNYHLLTGRVSEQRRRGENNTPIFLQPTHQNNVRMCVGVLEREELDFESNVRVHTTHEYENKATKVECVR